MFSQFELLTSTHCQSKITQKQLKSEEEEEVDEEGNPKQEEGIRKLTSKVGSLESSTEF